MLDRDTSEPDLEGEVVNFYSETGDLNLGRYLIYLIFFLVLLLNNSFRARAFSIISSRSSAIPLVISSTINSNTFDERRQLASIFSYES